MENKTLNYKGYKGSIEYSEHDQLYFGKVLDLPGTLISYEGKTPEDLEKDFQESIDCYLDK